MHVSLDSALGRQRRLNSVGESVLQIAPNAAAAYSLRSLTGGDPSVVRVRRSSNNGEQDFTAAGISSGALTSFVNEIQTLGTVTNSVGNDGFTLTNKSSTGFTATTDTATGVCGWPYTAKAGDKITVSFDAVIRSGTPQFIPRKATALSGSNLVDVVSDSAISVNSTASYSFEFTYDSDEAGSLTFSEGDDNADFDINNFQVTSFKGAGLVETWYDQSGNSKDAIQTTANLQPAIVVAGVFQNGLKFDSDGSSSGPDFRTPISSAQLSNDPAGHSGFALVWVGNVNQVQHADTSNHSVLGNLRNVQSFPTGTIGLSVIPKTGTTKFINEQGGSTSETVQDTNALTPGDFGVVFFSFEDAESGLDPLLSVDGSTTTSSLNSLNSSSSNNIGIMTAINSNNTIRYDRSADGICKEVILYTGDQKSKRAALETNIAAEYGITLS